MSPVDSRALPGAVTLNLVVDDTAATAFLADYRLRVKGMLQFAETHAVEQSIRILQPAIVRLTPRATGKLAEGTEAREFDLQEGFSEGDSGAGVSFLQPQRNPRGDRYWYFLASGYDLVYFGHPTGKHIAPKWKPDEPYPQEAYASVFQQLRAAIEEGAAMAVKVMIPGTAHPA